MLLIESLQDSVPTFVVAPHFVRGYSHSATLWQENLQLIHPKHHFIAG
jgi:hypothetical protein